MNAFLLILGIVWFSFCPCGVLTSQWSTINPVEIIIFSVKSKPNTHLWHVGLIQDHIKYERVLFGWPHNWKVSCVSLTAYASIAPVREWNFEKKVTWVSMFHPVLLVVWAFLLKTKEENDQSEKKNDERWRPRKSYFSIKITVLTGVTLQFGSQELSSIFKSFNQSHLFHQLPKFFFHGLLLTFSTFYSDKPDFFSRLHGKIGLQISRDYD